MKNSRLIVVDKYNFSALSGAELLSVFALNKREFVCECEKYFYKILIKGGAVYISAGETEYDMMFDKVAPMFSYKYDWKDLSSESVSIYDVMKKMKWTCDDLNIWCG